MAEHPSDRPANRLAGETSPYLLQHAQNPVDWYPWGPEAIAKARAEDRPIFLSVGYSACHWCHVMERESFENPAIAGLMNASFVNIKVDREERPDVDQIYMAAVQAITGQGGWPMSVFLTPDLQPFFGGTYYPPADGRGMPGFPRILSAVADAWADRRDEIVRSANEMTAQLRGLGQVPASEGDLDSDLLDGAAVALARAFDPNHGGFGQAPKFPHPMDLRVLLRQHARIGDPQALPIVRLTLDKMSRGGIYDHLGGGFARYSTDERWLVPHFEKMLYDNALLAQVYLEAFQATRDTSYAQTARETLDYVLGRMTDPEGGFYSTEDADSEGVEGKYYVWTLEEVRSILEPERAEAFAAAYDVTGRGNWEGHSILNLPEPLDRIANRLGRDEADLRSALAEDRARLIEAREHRVPPAKDTKILTSWNGLMLAPMAEASAILGDGRYVEAARRASGFLLDNLRKPDGRLLHAFKDGRARFDGYLDDYACLVDGLTRVFEATGEPCWIESAVELADLMVADFRDHEAGGFFYTAEGHEALIARPKEVYDNATPSGNAMAATALLRLAALTGRGDLRGLGRSTLRSVRAVLERAPAAAGQSLIALDFELAPPTEFAVIVGPDAAEAQAVLAAIAGRFLPRKVVAPSTPDRAAALAPIVPLLADRPLRDEKTTTYICERFACLAPIAGVDDLEAALGRDAR